MKTTNFLTSVDHKSPNKTVRYLCLWQRIRQDKIIGMHLLEIIFALAAAGLVLVGGFAIGYKQGEKQQRNLIHPQELDTLTALMESLSRFSAFAKKADDFYLDGVLRIWRTHLPTIQPEIVVDIQNGKVIYSSRKEQPVDWIEPALSTIKLSNPVWIDDDERLRQSLDVMNASPLLLAIQDNTVIRLVVFFLPEIPEEKRKTLAEFFFELNTVAFEIRKRALSANFYERLAQNLQESNTRMKRLFANVKHLSLIHI